MAATRHAGALEFATLREDRIVGIKETEVNFFFWNWTTAKTNAVTKTTLFANLADLSTRGWSVVNVETSYPEPDRRLTEVWLQREQLTSGFQITENPSESETE